MELIRFITEEEHAVLTELSKKEELQNDNSRDYYHAERMMDNEDVQYVSGILKSVIKDFESFSNFRSDSDLVRVQYYYGPGFVGVGYIRLTELLIGWAVV